MDIKITGMGQNIHEIRSSEQQEAVQQDHELEKKQTREEAQKHAEASVNDIKHLTNMLNRRLEYRIDEELNTIIVKVIDPETDKVIKELPPDELRRIRMRLRETAGLLFDQTI